MRDAAAPVEDTEQFDGVSYPMTSRSGEPYSVRNVRWPAFGDVTGEGLETITQNRLSKNTVIVIPDADQAPEQLFGLVPGVPADSQVARRLAEGGYHVIVPALIDRTASVRNAQAKLTNREFIYRPAFELGRHIIGYEVQKVLALVSLVTSRNPARNGKIGGLRLWRRRRDRALRGRA